VYPTYPTVGEALALPVVRRGRPRLVAGSGGLGRRVRWVHAAEVADIAHLLRGGELVLTTGIALPDEDAALTRYVDDLAAVGASGLVVELVRRWPDRLPEALLLAADRHRLPLVTLAAETRFVAVTEAVSGLIVDAQLAELRAAEHVHETFTALTVSCAEPAEVLREVARTTGLPVVLENLAHEMLAYDAAGHDPTVLLADWPARSRAVPSTDRTTYHPDPGWLVAMVGARHADWGRLILLCNTPATAQPDWPSARSGAGRSPGGPPGDPAGWDAGWPGDGEPSHRQQVVADRAASALAVQRLVTRDRDSLERQTHRILLTELLSDGVPPADLASRSAALGVPLDHRTLIGLAIRPISLTFHPSSAGPVDQVGVPAPALAAQEVLRDLAEATAMAAVRCGIPALVGVVDDTSVRGLLSLPPGRPPDPVLERLARQLHATVAGSPRIPPVVVAAGTTVDAIPGAARSLGEAAHVAGAALRSPVPGPPAGTAATDPACFRLADVRLRGLLHLLRDDERVGAFVSRELGRLLARDDPAGRRQLELLRCHCRHGGNKSAAAAEAHLSRTAYYQQLARIEKTLGVSLDDPESVLSLHVALLALDAVG
jgi:purine catabolism regulator